MNRMSTFVAGSCVTAYDEGVVNYEKKRWNLDRCIRLAGTWCCLDTDQRTVKSTRWYYTPLVLHSINIKIFLSSNQKMKITH